MKLSDVIAEFISESLSENGECEIGRNELALKFGCAPSQITYVITTRFSPNQGYIVTSRRGGGGYVRIARMCCDRRQTIMHIVNSIDGDMDSNTADIFLKNMTGYDYMTKDEAKMISAAVSESSLRSIPPKMRPFVRADIFKNMLISLL
ncbi:MAG: CtsR family transcriptional regulator [Clostridia bacterium]|nr:CtsR family transcriptional regulator [Clostridia bacterium]